MWDLDADKLRKQKGQMLSAALFTLYCLHVQSLLWILFVHLSSSWVRNQWRHPGNKILALIRTGVKSLVFGLKSVIISVVCWRHRAKLSVSFGVVTKFKFQVTWCIRDTPLCIRKLYRRWVCKTMRMISKITVIIWQFEPLDPKTFSKVTAYYFCVTAVCGEPAGNTRV